ncbi:unnamed protein product [Prunus armeniaca]|uniref:Uncharacterized protein n=1 Tax=Prunus armeniaca TaxID=36596 RepID=A0A6J5U155_PRUAR|nr:unnamed protein product [Prunus armeniaca]
MSSNRQQSGAMELPLLSSEDMKMKRPQASRILAILKAERWEGMNFESNCLYFQLRFGPRENTLRRWDHVTQEAFPFQGLFLKHLVLIGSFGNAFSLRFSSREKTLRRWDYMTQRHIRFKNFSFNASFLSEVQG